MKLLLLLVTAIAFTNAAFSQTLLKPVIKSFNSNTNAEQCISTTERKQVEIKLKQNVEQLKRTGKWPYAENRTVAQTKFIWPLKAASNYTDPEFVALSYGVDHDATSPGILDWNCGTRTYDGHMGSDLTLWPFAWLMMDNKNVKIIAGADGIIIDKHDGEFDRNCYPQGQVSNYVILQHADGSQSWYFHCKKGTVTSKAIGASVSKGEILGYVGSSGNSGGVHLHFEVHDASNAIVDPYKGPCNNISKSWWAAQPAYYGRKIHKTMVSILPAVYPACPNPEQSNENPNVPLGLNGYFYAFTSEMAVGDTMFLKILKPDASTWQSWYYVWDNTYSFAYAYWYWYFTTDLPTGIWKWQVTVKNKTSSYNFNVTASLSTSENNNYSSNIIPGETQSIQAVSSEKMYVFPNPANNKVQLKINCSAGDYQLQLIDATGKIIQQQNVKAAGTNSSFSIDVKNITPGLYKVKLYNSKISLQENVVIE